MAFEYHVGSFYIREAIAGLEVWVVCAGSQRLLDVVYKFSYFLHGLGLYKC